MQISYNYAEYKQVIQKSRIGCRSVRQFFKFVVESVRSASFAPCNQRDVATAWITVYY